MIRLSRNDEIGLRLMAEQGRAEGGFAASIACLHGILGEIDFLRAAAGIAPPDAPPTGAFKGILTEDSGRTREVRVPALDSLL